MGRSFNRTSLVGLVFIGLATNACAVTAEPEEEVSTDEAAVKKKVNPTGNNGAFDLLTTTWSPKGSYGGYTVGRRAIAIGDRLEFSPGTYNIAGVRQEANGVRTMVQLPRQVAIKAGQIASMTPTSLRVRYDSPINFGESRIALVPDGGQPGELDGRGAWAMQPKGVLMQTLPGKVRVNDGFGAITPVDLVEGKQAEVVLPTARVEVKLDAYDPAYPNARPLSNTGTDSAFLAWNDTRYERKLSVRQSDGAAVLPLTSPHSAKSEFSINTYCAKTSVRTVPGQVTTFTLNRLEVNDVAVTSPNGATTMVRGTYRIAQKTGPSTSKELCLNFPTHTGVDLPDGTYIIMSAAKGPGGTVYHEETVSFP